MVVGEASIHNIMGGMESTGGVRLHNHKRKLKQRFDIIKKLGQGTYGKVQLGINKETGQEVAIKTIKKCKIETKADLIRIRREIQIMSSVQHPNIIHIYEVFENREKMVLVMEYAAGGELYDYLSKSKVLTEHEARRIFRQIATAVFYCHKHKICHRDLKLENILLDQVGNAKIADFGLSNVFDEQRLLNTFCGSPLYASPEIVKGTPYHGPEVDCWSLGVLLYTLVYGAMPFDGSNFKRLVKQISQSDYFEPKKPSPASPLIKDMLTVCPARRADIEKICTHWWVNEGYEQNCLDIAEDLAAQTPVRLDLLLSLVPQSASAEKLLVGDQQQPGDVANNMSSETLVPTRCHSVGSLMELDQPSSERRIRDLFEDEPRTMATGEAKRKLETTPSMVETAAAGVKRKERARGKERADEREPRAYKSASRHHSAPIPNSITEEAMEIDPTVTVPTSKTVDLNQVEATAACLELIEECKERSPSKERSKTPVLIDQQKSQLPKEMSMQNVELGYEANQTGSEKVSFYEESLQPSEYKGATQKLTNNTLAEKQMDSAVIPNVLEGAVIDTNESEAYSSHDAVNVEATQREFKKLKEKAFSLDSELSNESRDAPAKTYERRRSKIFETAEKFNQLASGADTEKPKKIFIPGVNVGGAKRVFERKASLSSTTMAPPLAKPSASKVIIDVPTSEKKNGKLKQPQEPLVDDRQREEAKKRAVDIISGAIGKPPMQRKGNGSPPMSPQNNDPKKLPLKIPVAPNDVRTATVSVSTPIETKFPFEKAMDQDTAVAAVASETREGSETEEPKMSSKMEITLKSATLPRPRKTSKAEISLSGVKSPESTAFKAEVEAKIDAFHPQKLRTQRSEIAFPVAAATPTQTIRSSSLEPEGRSKSTTPKERIIPIQVEPGHQHSQHASTPPPKPPMPQRSMSQRSGSLSRQSTADSDTDSALGSTVGPEPIRKSPREYIIPIAVEGGGYVTPRSGSVEPESKTSTPTSTNPPRSRFGRGRRMSSLLSDASEDESPFSSLHRDSEDLLQRHMHRLRSSRPSRQPPEHADSLSSGEDDDDDGFELLTAENLFSTLLSRVRSLTQRLNVDDNRTSGYRSSRLFGRLGSNPPQPFWGLNKPLSRRLTESQFKHSLSREGDIFSRKDSTNAPNSGTPNSPESHSNLSRENVFELGSNTLPRDKVEHEDVEAEAAQVRKEAQETLEQSFTPSLARRLSRQSSLPYYRSPSRDRPTGGESIEQKSRPLAESNADRPGVIRRSNSLLETGPLLHHGRCSPGRSISLFDDEDEDRLVPAFPRQIMTLGRKYKENGKSVGPRRENFNLHKTEKIQEEMVDDASSAWKENSSENSSNLDNGSVSESVCDSNAIREETISSVSASIGEASSLTESSSNPAVDQRPAYKSSRDPSPRNFESRLLAAENLIKESKLKNLGPSRFNPNLSSNYKETEKCEKDSLASIGEERGSMISKRRSYIPSLRLRSGSLTRESSLNADRRRSFTGSQDALGRAFSPEKSLLGKFFGGNGGKETECKDKTQKPKQHRISRFLRPDFFDTPREESQYVKEKEARKAAENERRKSRFMKKKNDEKSSCPEEKREKELKNEINSLKKEYEPEIEVPNGKNVNGAENESVKIERQESKSSFLHSLEKKLEKLRSSEEPTKGIANGRTAFERKTQQLRETSAPPADSSDSTISGLAKKAISVEDLSAGKPERTSSSKSRVSSVLGLFKNSDAKQANGSKPQNILLNKLKRSPPKLAKAESISTEDASSMSKIPTKFSKSDSKVAKKLGETKKPVDRSASEIKKSPPKEKLKEKLTNGKEKKTLSEKPLKEMKKSEGFSEVKTDGKVKMDKTDSLSKEDKKSSDEPLKPIVDANQSEGLNQLEDKKLLKTKKNSSLANSSSNSETIKREEVEKKVKKVTKPTKDASEKEEGDATKKKKIVRVVKKVVKKSSDSLESKPEDKVKASKTLLKKKTLRNTEKSPEPCGVSSISKQKVKETNPDSQVIIKDVCPNVTKESDVRGEVTTEDQLHSRPTNEPIKLKTDSESAAQIESKPAPAKAGSSKSQLKSESQMLAAEVKSELAVARSDSKVLQIRSTEESERQETKTKPTEQQRANRNSLKLDLSKIPQHTFRHSTPKRESPKIESPKGNVNTQAGTSDESPKVVETVSDKLMECLSRTAYHGTDSGSKTGIEKPLRAKDVAELKREVTECARIIESHVDHGQDCSVSITDELTSDPSEDKLSEEPVLHYRRREPSSIVEETQRKESPNDYSNELFSPMDEPESFDSWSVSSADFNHPRADLQSPTSPSNSLFSRSDTSESVIDRIRRRSFYLRFNDRKRPSLSVPPPGITVPMTSTTLPRKYSLSSSRDRSRYGSYGSSNRDRGYNLYSDESLPPKKPSSSIRYSEMSSGSPHLCESKSPSEHYALSSSYDPLRRYLRSPTFDLSTTRGRYHSADFASDSELGSCYHRTPPQRLPGFENMSEHAAITLPRKYGETTAEPKTVEYYEELLAPSNPEYLSMRKSPLPMANEYLSKCENGFHNGNVDLHFSTGRRKSYAGKLASGELEDSDQDITEQKRKGSEQANESRNVVSTPTELLNSRAAE